MLALWFSRARAVLGRPIVVAAILALLIAVPASAQSICTVGSIIGAGKLTTWSGGKTNMTFSIEGHSDAVTAAGTLSFIKGPVTWTSDGDAVTFNIVNDGHDGPYDWVTQQGKIKRNGVSGWCYRVQAGDYYPSSSWGPDTFFLKLWKGSDCFGTPPKNALDYRGPVSSAGGGDISIDGTHCGDAPPTADVSVVKTADDASINAGQEAAFTIEVSSLGPESATNVTLSDPLPDGITWTQDNSACAISSGPAVLDCTFGDMVAGATETIHAHGTTTTDSCPSLTNTATVAAGGDTNSANDSSTASITVVCPLPPPSNLLTNPDLESVLAPWVGYGGWISRTIAQHHDVGLWSLQVVTKKKKVGGFNLAGGSEAPVSGDTQYTFSLWVYSTVEADYRIGWDELDAGKANWLGPKNTTVHVPANAWTPVSLTATTETDTRFVNPYFDTDPQFGKRPSVLFYADDLTLIMS